jgi:hypothetical protein
MSETETYEDDWEVMDAIRTQQKADLALIYQYCIKTETSKVFYYANAYALQAGCVVLTDAVRVSYRGSCDWSLPYDVAPVARVVLRGRRTEIYQCRESK